MRAQKRQLPVSRLDDPDMQAAPAAMERALRRAHKVAHQHGTTVLVVESGKLVESNRIRRCTKTSRGSDHE